MDMTRKFGELKADQARIAEEWSKQLGPFITRAQEELFCGLIRSMQNVMGDGSEGAACNTEGTA